MPRFAFRINPKKLILRELTPPTCCVAYSRGPWSNLPLPSAGGRIHDRSRQMQSGEGAQERGVPVRIERTVAADYPVTTSVRGGDHAIDRDPTRNTLPGNRPEEGRIPEGEHPAVRGHQPVPTPVGRRRHAHDGFVERHAPGRAMELRFPKENTPPSEATNQYPPPSGVAAMPTMGLLSAMPPVEPWNCAFPKENTPPSEATNQYPPPSGVAAMPTMGLLSAMPPVEPWNCAFPKENTPPSEATNQYPPPSGVAAMPTMGLLSAMPPVEPWNCAFPKENTPPSVAVIHNPCPWLGGIASCSIRVCSVVLLLRLFEKTRRQNSHFPAHSSFRRGSQRP